MARSRTYGRTKTIGVLAIYAFAIALVVIARFLGVETREDAEEFASIILIPLSILVLAGAAVVLYRRSKGSSQKKFNRDTRSYKVKK